jgi:hypothetical protein
VPGGKARRDVPSGDAASATLFGVRSPLGDPFSEMDSGASGPPAADDHRTVFGLRAITDDVVPAADSWDDIASGSRPGVPMGARPATPSGSPAVERDAPGYGRGAPAGGHTVMGLSAITPDDDGPAPTPLDAVADDWLDDIENFIEKKVADGSLNVPGSASGSSAEVAGEASQPNAGFGIVKRPRAAGQRGGHYAGAAGRDAGTAVGRGASTVRPPAADAGRPGHAQAAAPSERHEDDRRAHGGTMVFSPDMLKGLQEAPAQSESGEAIVANANFAYMDGEDAPDLSVPDVAPEPAAYVAPRRHEVSDSSTDDLLAVAARQRLPAATTGQPRAVRVPEGLAPRTFAIAVGVGLLVIGVILLGWILGSGGTTDTASEAPAATESAP